MAHKSSDRLHPYIVGQQVIGRVEKVFPFGVFLRLEDGTRAYLRRRELSLEGDVDPRETISVGETIQAAVLSLGEPGRLMELSVRSLLPDPWDQFTTTFRVRDVVTVVIKQLSPHGAFAQIVPGVDGFIPLGDLALWEVERVEDVVWVGDHVEAMITRIDRNQKRVSLSIRQRMEQLARVETVVARMSSGEGTSTLAKVGLMPADEQGIVPQNHERLSPILVVDEHDFVREPLVKWLESLGYETQGAKTDEEVLALCQVRPPGVIIVDLERHKPQISGPTLIRRLRAQTCEAVIAVMSSPEWVDLHYNEIEDLGVAAIFAKPMDPAEVRRFLIEVGSGKIQAVQYDIGKLASEIHTSRRISTVMRSGLSLAERMHEGLSRLLRATGAEQAVVFHLDRVSKVISVIAKEGVIPLNDEKAYSLINSPVRDAIQEQETIWENHISQTRTARFEKLLGFLPFESCIGVPIEANGQVDHALFLFHRRPKSFSHYRVRDAWAMATLFAVAIEKQSFDERIRNQNAMLLRGRLSTVLSHEIGNRLLGLETIVQSVRSDVDALLQEHPELGDAPNLTDARIALDEVAETSAELRNLFRSFHQLMQATSARTTDVNEVLQRCIESISIHAEKAEIDLRADLSESLPLVIGNEIGLRHVFLNLILNAIQHMELKPTERRILEISTRSEDVEDHSIVKVRFTDSGPGIHRQLWEKIFALGFTTKPGGLGLGLYIARSLVESMGGYIFVEESLVPLGTTFAVTLLVAEEDEA